MIISFALSIIILITAAAAAAVVVVLHLFYGTINLLMNMCFITADS